MSEDVDMKAAAALTSLRLQSRGSMGEVSPRSSMSAAAAVVAAVMDAAAGGGDSHSHFAQSSTRTTTGEEEVSGEQGEGAGQGQGDPGLFGLGVVEHRTTTPSPPTSAHGAALGMVTPKSVKTGEHPTDSEAADLMLYLATSPSPARPTTGRERDGTDAGAFRTLVGGGLRTTGRVLFETEGPTPTPTTTRLTPQQLLPPPPPPPPPSVVVPTSPRDDTPRTPSGVGFNIHDFIHASPSTGLFDDGLGIELGL